RAGVDMEMASTSYAEYIPALLEEGLISQQQIDESVRKILSLKFRLGLFDNPYTDASEYPELLNPEHLALARKLARQSLVLLKNADGLLPLSVDLKKVAVIGPLADAPHDQLGTWVFDGEKKHSITPLSALRSYLEDKSEVLFAPGLKISRTKETGGFAEAVEAAGQADVILLFLGEESILSGESHCRADISLPGAQEDLVKVLSETGKPMVGIILAGRPLTIRPILDLLDAVIYAWHPGTMAGPAIADILYGIESPSGKIPVTFPTTAGQIPMYYAHKNTGKPPTEESWVKMEDIPVEPFQLSIGNTSHYLDEGYKPLFPFGFGLSYTTFEYSDLKVSDQSMPVNEKITVSATVTNSGTFDADEIVQLYVRDLFASRTRPVRELKRFQRIHLKTGESRLVSFTLEADDLTFHNPEMKKVVEPGRFHVWIGGSSETGLMTEFEIVNGSEERQD
ncbi:MAG: glycoside hydrolase family 3 C-terminal domain-containing protein, partial [Calditrichaeota bacterium]|nr:glycoside hydrolase family 3 C-terminal domain-containing protein [Calditrichota bacterium]